MRNIDNLDLNLLKTLDVLLSERSVTRAARRLNLSQPSVSIQLGRLRKHFGDPLLIAVPGGMIPTPYAESLEGALHQALESVWQVISPRRAFDPVKADLTWRVAASDYGESTILLPALKNLQSKAPFTRLAIMEMVPSRIVTQLSQSQLDLAFMTRDEAPDGMRQRMLFSEEYVLTGRVDHPLLTNELSLDDFSRLRHIVVSQEGGGFSGITDQILSLNKLKRRVALSVPHFLFVPQALQHSDMVAMVPSRLVRQNPLLKSVPFPLKIPGFEMLMVWHERHHHDPAHRWLRDEINSAFTAE